MKKRIQSVVYFFCFIVLLYFITIYKVVSLQDLPDFLPVVVYSLITSAYIYSRFVLLAFYSDDHKKKYSKTEYPSVSVVIACKNEEDSIYRTIKTVFRSKYPGHLNCIAVDDGSTDNTFEEMQKAKREFGDKLKVITFPTNRGKREGMSEGVLASDNEIIVFVDSDSFIKKTAIRKIVEHFIEDKSIGAISGNSGVENVKTNLLTKMQEAKYAISFDIFKACESVFGAVTCCPGCFSAYRKSSILRVIDKWRNQQFLGTKSTFGDDRSLTNYILEKDKVIYCQAAKATTIAPDRYKVFFKQQFRWKKSWIREGFNAGRFIWRKHPLSALAFYTNLVIPIISPLIVIWVIDQSVVLRQLPIVFIVGVIAMSALFGLYHKITFGSKYWWYIIPYAALHGTFLVWQMPWAIIKVRDTKWGTR